MHHLILPALVGLFLFVSCGTDAPAPPPPVNEYLVVGNDRGFRDDFINQADHVTVFDSSLRIRSLLAADSYRDYPIVNGYVQGGNDPLLHWKYGTVGNDTITVRDTARNSTFYLRRLGRVDSLPAVVDLLTSGELRNGEGPARNFGYRQNRVFNNLGQNAGCLVMRDYYGYRDWTSIRSSEKSDTMPEVLYYLRSGGDGGSIWRMYSRFSQPILVYRDSKSQLTVIPLDSLSANRDTLYGWSVNNRSFNYIGRTVFIRAAARTELSPRQLLDLPAAPLSVELQPTKIRDQHRHRWEKDEDPEQYLTAYPDELNDLQLRFPGPDRLIFGTGEKDLLTAEYRLHDTAPYLVVGDECDDLAYWHYERSGDTLMVRIPLRIHVPVEQKTEYMTVNGKEIAIPPSRWYARDEWRASYLLVDPGEPGR